MTKDYSLEATTYERRCKCSGIKGKREIDSKWGPGQFLREDGVRSMAESFVEIDAFIH